MLSCDFCGKSEHDVRMLVSGPRTAAICDSCARTCVLVVGVDVQAAGIAIDARLAVREQAEWQPFGTGFQAKGSAMPQTADSVWAPRSYLVDNENLVAAIKAMPARRRHDLFERTRASINDGSWWNTLSPEAALCSIARAHKELDALEAATKTRLPWAQAGRSALASVRRALRRIAGLRFPASQADQQ